MPAASLNRKPSPTFHRRAWRSSTSKRRPLSVMKVTRTSNVTQDALGSVRAVTGPDGSVVARFDYDAWGNTLASSVDGVPGGWNYLFVGSLGVRYDAATRLHYCRARWYDASGLQRFVSRDRLRSMNRYSYALNNPTTYVDITGESPTPLTGNQSAQVTAAIGLIQQVDPYAASELTSMLNSGHIQQDVDTAGTRAYTSWGAFGRNVTTYVDPQYLGYQSHKDAFFSQLLLATTLIHELAHVHHGFTYDTRLGNPEKDRDTYKALSVRTRLDRCERLLMRLSGQPQSRLYRPNV